MRKGLGAFVLFLALLGGGSAHAATLQPIGGFERPVGITSDPGNPNRIFVVERTGRIALVENGTISTFADIHTAVSCCEGETGLFSMALAPDFDTSGRFYVDYSGTEAEPSIHVSEMHASGNTAAATTLREVLTIEHTGNTHFAGDLQFGPEGDLFVSTGDGDGAQGNDEPNKNAQKLESPLGKILRINPAPSGVLPFTVPADNPFVGVPKAYEPIWSLGLRNPFRFSFDRGGAGMLIGDVGQSRREEVDFAAAPGLGRGANYGWNCFEASLPGEKAAGNPACTAPPSAFTPPIFEYSHGPGCAIIGGYVVHDLSLGSLVGRYLYGDLCTGELRSFELANPSGSDRGEGITVPELDSFGEDSCGRIYVASQAGVVSRLVGTVASTCTPPPAPHAASTIGIKPLRRKVRRHKRATLSVFVSPCNGRKGEPVKLFSGRRHVATRHLSLACTVRFRPRITRKQGFRAEIAEDATYVAAYSRTLHIAIDHSKPKQHKKKSKSKKS
jgi:glucose/arabinose dehydrogenase